MHCAFSEEWIPGFHFDLTAWRERWEKPNKVQWNAIPAIKLKAIYIFKKLIDMFPIQCFKAVEIHGLSFYPFWFGPANCSAKTFQKSLIFSDDMLWTVSAYCTMCSSKNQCSHCYWPACFNIYFAQVHYKIVYILQNLLWHYNTRNFCYKPALSWVIMINVQKTNKRWQFCPHCLHTLFLPAGEIFRNLLNSVN